MFSKLKAIVWKDLLKKRWAIIVELHQVPTAPDEFLRSRLIYVPCVARLPVKRPLTQSYNDFVNEHSRMVNLVITGSKHTLKHLGNVGAVLPHNFYAAEKGHKAVDNRELNNLLAQAIAREDAHPEPLSTHLR